MAADPQCGSRSAVRTTRIWGGDGAGDGDGDGDGDGQMLMEMEMEMEMTDGS